MFPGRSLSSDAARRIKCRTKFGPNYKKVFYHFNLECSVSQTGCWFRREAAFWISADISQLVLTDDSNQNKHHRHVMFRTWWKDDPNRNGSHGPVRSVQMYWRIKNTNWGSWKLLRFCFYLDRTRADVQSLCRKIIMITNMNVSRSRLVMSRPALWLVDLVTVKEQKK